ncbi:MAG: class I SAM-dependent methyltransferase, partial [Rivularia sp. (in: cyanobacteria)]
MNKNDVPKIYDEDYAQRYNKKFIFSDCHADFEEAVLRSLLNELGNEIKWLDVACGTGYFLSRFPNIKRCGMDISPAMLDVARKDNPEVSFVEGDFKDKYLQ